MTARIFTALMGGWQYLSALAWARSSAAFMLIATSGLLAVLFAFLAARVSWARYANVAVGVAVFLLSFALFRWGSPPYWNSIIVGLSIAVGGFASGTPQSIRYERDLYGRISA